MKQFMISKAYSHIQNLLSVIFGVQLMAIMHNREDIQMLNTSVQSRFLSREVTDLMNDNPCKNITCKLRNAKSTSAFHKHAFNTLNNKENGKIIL